uniref:uncharacterized protein LOC120346418 n=1 Tax=Styela clava TaxID=7725 RepID=UPI00193AAE41|nr:uncharacterized protein LOC120346418 [Styela clava]
MAMQFLYACAVLSSILHVSVSASFDAEAFVSTPRSGVVGSVEAGAPATAKGDVDTEIASLDASDVPSVIDSVNNFLASHPKARPRRNVVFHIHYMAQSFRIPASTTGSSIVD